MAANLKGHILPEPKMYFECVDVLPPRRPWNSLSPWQERSNDTGYSWKAPCMTAISSAAHHHVQHARGSRATAEWSTHCMVRSMARARRTGEVGAHGAHKPSIGRLGEKEDEREHRQPLVLSGRRPLRAHGARHREVRLRAQEVRARHLEHTHAARTLPPKRVLQPAPRVRVVRGEQHNRGGRLACERRQRLRVHAVGERLAARACAAVCLVASSHVHTEHAARAPAAGGSTRVVEHRREARFVAEARDKRA
mmetsp:Transcript_14384/g.37275  ORF Transcript_14384/g.37275 Transcript_14384/m.37275 type:complete len:252 (-) Transcript_14384:702-1457(-)